MKISEGIKALQMQLAEHGDLDIVSVTDIDAGIIVDLDRIFEVIEMPNEDESALVKVSAFVTPIEDQAPAFKVLR